MTDPETPPSLAAQMEDIETRLALWREKGPLRVVQHSAFGARNFLWCDNCSYTKALAEFHDGPFDWMKAVAVAPNDIALLLEQLKAEHAKNAALTVQVERLEQRNRGILQRFYDVTTWLVSEAPYGHVEDGARQEYHDALLALTTLRDELRREGLIQHDEEWWHRSQKLAALRGSDR